MIGLKTLLKKKEKLENDGSHPARPDVPSFTFVRTTTDSQEVIEPPSFPDEDKKSDSTTAKTLDRKHHFAFRKSANADVTRDPTATSNVKDISRPSHQRKLSDRLHDLRNRSRSTSASASASTSTHLPDDLPDAPTSIALDDAARDKDAQEQREAQWEKRATILAQVNPLADEQPEAVAATISSPQSSTHSKRPRVQSRTISDKRGDENIQEAIRLHEIGELGLSTAMFGRLGNPQGDNNALAQVLYGLALRHGWGVEVDAERAVQFLSLAATNAAAVERQALEAGMNGGGAAKGELVLAMFELANCYRHGWGVRRDAVAARQYYETAANLGDVDGMQETANCYLEGVGGKKDKFKAAQYLRLAEERGRKQVGSSWIYKDKYMNPKS